MSLPTNTFTTVTAIGNREDLSEAIYNVDPTETPFISAIEREKATAVLHEWQTQAIAAVDTANARLEGDDAVTNAATPTVRLTNRTQISDKTFRVSGTQEAVDHAGRDSEFAYQETLQALALKRDIEGVLVGTNQAKVTGTATVAATTASVLSWIGTNDDFGTAGGAASPTTLDGAATRTDGTQRAFTEALLKNSLRLIYESGGKPDVIMVGSFNKQAFSNFTGRATPMEETKSKKIVASVDVYESDFGTLKVVPNRLMRTRDCLILQLDMWAQAHLNGRKMVSSELAKTGDSRRKQILSEYVLVSRNEKASGGVFDLTTS